MKRTFGNIIGGMDDLEPSFKKPLTIESVTIMEEDDSMHCCGEMTEDTPLSEKCESMTHDVVSEQDDNDAECSNSDGSSSSDEGYIYDEEEEEALGHDLERTQLSSINTSPSSIGVNNHFTDAGILSTLDLRSFYDMVDSKRHHLTRGIQRNLYDDWHEYMATLVTRHPSAMDVVQQQHRHSTVDSSNNVEFGNEHMHNVRDILSAFYDWYLAGCPGAFCNDSTDCWISRWNRTHPSSFTAPSTQVFKDLYMDFHRFLARVEYAKGLRDHVHMILLLHSLFDDHKRGTHQRYLQFCQSPSAPLTRMLTMSSVDLMGEEVWNVYTTLARCPQVLIPSFFIFLAKNCQVVLGKRIDWLVECEHAAQSNNNNRRFPTEMHV